MFRVLDFSPGPEPVTEMDYHAIILTIGLGSVIGVLLLVLIVAVIVGICICVCLHMCNRHPQETKADPDGGKSAAGLHTFVHMYVRTYTVCTYIPLVTHTAASASEYYNTLIQSLSFCACHYYCPLVEDSFDDRTKVVMVGRRSETEAL